MYRALRHTDSHQLAETLTGAGKAFLDPSDRVVISNTVLEEVLVLIIPAGRIVTSKVEGYAGNTIFLPAAGYRGGTSLYYAGSYGLYWSSSLLESSSDGARYVLFYSGEVLRDISGRRDGFSVRPVSE